MTPNRIATASGEGEVGEPEHDRLGHEVLQVAPDPGRRGDGHRARDHDRAQVAQPDAGADPCPVGTSVSRTPSMPPAVMARTATRGSGIDSARAAAPERAERHGRAVAARAGGDRDQREQQPGERAEDEEQAQVRRRDEGRAADVESHRRVERDRGERTGRPVRPARRPTRSAASIGPAGRAPVPTERDDQEHEQAHSTSSGAVGRGSGRRSVGPAPARRAAPRPGRTRRSRRERAAIARTAMAPPSAAIVPAVISDSRVVGVPPQADPDQERALQQEAQADAARG